MNGLLPKWLLKIAAMSCCYAASVPLFEWCFNSKLSFAYLLNEYWISLVYTVFIASVLSVGTPLVWQKSCRSPVVLRWLARGSFVFFGTGIACLLAGLIPWAVFRETYGYWQSFFESFRMALILSTIAVAFIASYETQKGRLRVSEMQLKTKELERERALKLATEARLSSLESRIHPHFLFNTINSVSSLIPEDPQRAERVLAQMASLLRFSLDSAQLGLVPLEREMKVVEDYLEIERVRFGSRLRYKVDIPADLQACPVPPLSIQTLVENSVKYAVSARREGALVTISALLIKQRLALEVRDDGLGFPDLALPAGHGLSN